MVLLPPLTYIVGISAIVLFSLGTLMCIAGLYKYKNERKSLQPWVALMGLCLGSLYLGGMIGFLYLAFTGNNLSPTITGILAYTPAPVGVLAAMYLGFSIFKPELVKKMMIIFAMTGIVYYICLFGFSDLMISGEIPYTQAATDASLESVLLALTIFYILSLLIILGGGFYKLSKRIEGHDRQKALSLFYGFSLFAIGAIIDTVAPTSYIFIPRIIVIVSFFFLYRGFLVDLS